MYYKRIFLLVFDSLGIGNGKDAKKYDDVGSNTLNSVLSAAPFNLPCLAKLGFLNLATNLAFHTKEYDGVVTKINQVSTDKDSLTGHFEMMGVKSEDEAHTFYKNGFPSELIEELEKVWGKSVIVADTFDDIETIRKYGEEQLKTDSIIIYPSFDSTLNILANESKVSVSELDNLAKLAREVLNKKEWKVNRVVARQYIGTNMSNFFFTRNCYTYMYELTQDTYLDNLKNNNYDVIALGDIKNIFSGKGITYGVDTKSNIDALDKLIGIVKSVDFTGLCYTNLNEYDKYGHLRNPVAYLRCLEDTDVKLRTVVNNMRNDDLLIISASHANDPGFKGNDHTREQLPFVAYSKSLSNKGHLISAQEGLSCIGATINENFELEQKDNQTGNSLLSMIK